MIIFSYKISDFVNNAQVLSMYKASSSFNFGKEESSDDTSLKAEDVSFLTKYLKSGVMVLANIISGYTKDLTNSKREVVIMDGEPVEFDVVYGNEPNSIVFRLNMPETFNEAILGPMDEAIKDALESYVLYRTAKLRAVEYLSYQEDYEQALGQVRNYINRRIKGVRRNYNLI